MLRALAGQAIAGKLTHDQAAKTVRQRQGKKKRRARNIRVVFCVGDECTITVTCVRTNTYSDMEQALLHAVDEVRLRLRNNVRLA